MNIRLMCPTCEHPGRLAPAVSRTWQCPGCDHRVELPADGPAGALPHCLVCGDPELYKKKDFPHWLGLTVLTASCLTFLVASLLYHQWWGWAVLLGTAVFDGLLYLAVGDVVVCYRCGAQYRGFPADPAHKPFELGTAERYRQERLRREQLQAEKNSGD